MGQLHRKRKGHKGNSLSKNRYELDTERLATTDEKGARIYLYPEDTRGVWHHRRSFFAWFLILLYLVLPWTSFQGKQTILLNIATMEFTIFGQTFFATDLPLLVIIFLGGILLIGFVTSIWGRIWCGWACPQTVFIEAIYSKIEILVEGKARTRRALDQGPWNFNKLWRKSLKWLLFIIVSLHIAHSFIGYFVGTKELFWMTLRPPSEHPTAFAFMVFITLLCLFDFGWFREQFCIIACPYGRLQSVIMDKNSIVVAYDGARGEPRRSPEVARENEGDCINCYHCVRTCPTGIDIRRGTQLECIACTKCIDACDEIMLKVGKPSGLIRYTTEAELSGEKVPLIRARSLIYLALTLLIFGSGFAFIKKSQQMSLSVIRAVGTPFRETGTKEITNHYVLTIDNKDEVEKKYLWFQTSNPQVKIVSSPRPLPVKVGHSRANIFFKFSPDLLNAGTLKIKLQVKTGDRESEVKLLKEMEVVLVGPL